MLIECKRSIILFQKSTKTKNIEENHHYKNPVLLCYVANVWIGAQMQGYTNYHCWLCLCRSLVFELTLVNIYDSYHAPSLYFGRDRHLMTIVGRAKPLPDVLNSVEDINTRYN